MKNNNRRLDRPHIQRLRPDVAHFFDTNFFVLAPGTLPQLKHVPVRHRYVTESVEQELLEKLGADDGRRVFESGFQTLRLNDLFTTDPNICPVYHWYLSAMYNPANVGNFEEFFAEAFAFRIIKDTVTPAVRKAFEELRRRSRPDATPVGLEFMQEATTRARKKARQAQRDKHPAYLRDIKNLALVLYYSLRSKRNVIYYTADGDPIPLFLKWLDSVAMQSTLKCLVLPKLLTLEPRYLAQGGTVDIVLDAADFVQRKYKMARGLLDDKRKTTACRFTIKHWNQAEGRFDEETKTFTLGLTIKSRTAWPIFTEICRAPLRRTTSGEIGCR